MNPDERSLLALLTLLTDRNIDIDRNALAVLVQSHIAAHGPLSEETAAKVRSMFRTNGSAPEVPE